MAIYTVHMPPGAMPDRARFIREGVNLPALLVPFFWLLWHRLWLALVLYIVFVFALAELVGTNGNMLFAFLSLLPNLYLFIEGNERIRAKLARKGWQLVDVVEAGNIAEAEIRYFASRADVLPRLHQEQSRERPGPTRSQPSAAPAAAAAGEPGIGIFSQ